MKVPVYILPGESGNEILLGIPEQEALGIASPKDRPRCNAPKAAHMRRRIYLRVARRPRLPRRPVPVAAATVAVASVAAAAAVARRRTGSCPSCTLP